MISTILLSVVPAVAPTSYATTPADLVLILDEEVEKRIAEAGEDVAKLLELANTYDEADDGEAERLVYRRILEIDSEHEAAHKALRHHLYDGKWFVSYAQLSKYRREEAKRMKEEFGMVRFNDEWVPEVDLPYLRMGWVKDENDSWVSQHKLDRIKKVAELTEAGWQLQGDLTWVSPDEVGKWEEGLWKVGEEWMSKEEANTYHAQLGHWWEVPSEAGHFIGYSTCDRDTVAWVNWYADQTYDDLVRAVGLEPEEPPVFVCLSSVDQYNEFAAGSQANQLPPSEIDGFSSLHYSFFAESFFDITVSPPEYKGCGVAYWDIADANLKPYGLHSIRHAAAHSYLEAVDPSWNAVSQIVSHPGGGQASTDGFWAEKKIPRWLRYGLASYAERYFRDATVDQNGNPWWARDWALSNLGRQGDLDPLDHIFTFRLDLNDIPASTRLIHEAGLVVAFVLDGECQPVNDAHMAFKAALKSGQDAPAAVTALQVAIQENQGALEAFAEINVGTGVLDIEPAEVEAADADADADASADAGADAGEAADDDAGGASDGDAAEEG